MALNDVKVTVTGGGLGRREPSEDMICGIMTTGVAATGLALDQTYELNLTEDLEALGVTAAYDTANNVLIYHHVSEFFRMNPNGKLFLRVTAQTATMTDLADDTKTNAKQLLIDANGKVRVVAIIRNPVISYTATAGGGLDADVFTAVPKAQALSEAEFAAHRPVAVIIEGRSLSGTSATVTDLRTLNAENVAVCIGQDKTVASKHAIFGGYAAVGTLLGTISAAKVNENVAWVRKFPLTSVPAGRFINVSLSSGNLMSSYSDGALGVFNDKGYIFARPHTGFAGYWWNDSATCVTVSSDFAYLENVRTIQKAARAIRKQLLPDLNSPLGVDSESGKLDAVTCKYFEAQGAVAISPMLQDNEITGFDVYVDPEQNVLSTSKLIVKFKLTPYGTARQIEGQVGFDNPLNS